MSIRKKSETSMQTEKPVVITDQWTSHHFLAPNDYCQELIGICSLLLRCYENEHFGKFFCPEIRPNAQIRDFIAQLNDCEKPLNEKNQVDIERCLIIARLREYLDQNTEQFQYILSRNQEYTYQHMTQNLQINIPTIINENQFHEYCEEQNDFALALDQAYRKRRFQFYADQEFLKPMSIINLQHWLSYFFKILFDSIPRLNSPDILRTDLGTLINNSFLIVRHPSPPIATHSAANKNPVTAKIHCRLLCLLDKTDFPMTIENTTPFVRLINTPDQPEKISTVYQQQPLTWKTYSIVTASNTTKNFSCAELSKIVLERSCTDTENNDSIKPKTRYATRVYCIEFNILVKVQFPNGYPPITHSLTVRSAPFGLVSNTSQKDELFPKVFIEDMKSWRPQIPSPIPISNNEAVTHITQEITIDELVNNIRRYHIHQTGIFPKSWVIEHIQKILMSACHNKSESIETLCYAPLTNIFAQIHFIAEHPVLALLHHDGLFLSICDTNKVDQALQSIQNCFDPPVCAIRLAELTRMKSPKEIGVRIDLIQKTKRSITRCTLDGNKFENALSEFLIRVLFGQAPQYQNVLISLNMTDPQFLDSTVKYARYYYSDKLRQLCPCDGKYTSLWDILPSDEPTSTIGQSLPPISLPLQPIANTMSPTATNTIVVQNTTVDLPSTFDSPYSQPQIQSPIGPPIYVNSLPEPRNIITNQINQPNPFQSPLIIIITDPAACTMSNDNVLQLVHNKLPQCASLMQTSTVYRISSDQSFNKNI